MRTVGMPITSVEAMMRLLNTRVVMGVAVLGLAYKGLALMLAVGGW